MNEDLQITKLGMQDLENVMALQKKIIDNLEEDKKHFTVCRSKNDFMKALTGSKQCMYGIYVGKNLVAQSILSFAEDEFVAAEAPELVRGYSLSDVAVYKAVLVDPAYRGKGLMKRMLQAREDMAVICGKKIAMCKISADNNISLENALKHGMQIAKIGVDKTGHEKLYLQKSLEPKLFMSAKYQNAFIMRLAHNNKFNNVVINKMGALCKQGKIGFWDKQLDALVWAEKGGQVKALYQSVPYNKLKER
ncbi:MAG: GNAT family N-acetyltransferase [Lactobacillus sp.]|jgi:GNAT superfamily N-acetyltransferase|nr:GNAT family N-acetyltransferase [Lactobacillus sp.]